MVIEEPFNTSRRPLWLKITFICFILIIGASVVPSVIKRQDIRNEILVIPTGYRGCSDDSTKINLFAESLYTINPFTASNDSLLKSFKLSFKSEPKRLGLRYFCSVVWENSILFFGEISAESTHVNPRRVTMLTGCKVKQFEQALPSIVSKHGWFDGYGGVCTTVQDKIMLCFGIFDNLRQCRQLEIALIGGNLTATSFKSITESLFLHGPIAGPIASINGYLTFVI